MNDRENYRLLSTSCEKKARDNSFEIDFGIVRSFAHAVEWAVKKYKKDPADFLYKTLDTKIFASYTDDCSLYGQSSSCIAGKILEELEKAGITVKNVADEEYISYDIDAGYWMGYVVMYWVFWEHITGAELKQYDFSEFYWGYDVLHTQDVKYAIRIVKEEYGKGN